MAVEGVWWRTFGRTRALVRVELVRRRAAVVIFILRCRWYVSGFGGFCWVELVYVFVGGLEMEKIP